MGPSGRARGQLLRRPELEDLARGCAVLGSGGGGDVELPLLQAGTALEHAGHVRVVSIDDVEPGTLVMPVAGWGAPTVGIEKLGSGREGMLLRDAVERWFGREVGALMAGEIGGGNGVLPFAWAAAMGLPVVDADGMGRAFPEGPQCVMNLAGLSPAPAFFADEHGNVVTISPVDPDWYERLARTIAVVFGGVVAGAEYVMDGAAVGAATVPGSVTNAVALGRAIRRDGIDGLLDAGAIKLVGGKVTDVDRRTTGGFAVGEVIVEGTGEDRGRTVRIHVQNENLLAMEGDTPLAIVPDLITLVDEATGTAVPTERVRFGQRVVALGIACPDVWRGSEGLRVAGPAHFGYELDYVPVEDLIGA